MNKGFLKSLFKLKKMKILNMNQHSGYPMLKITNIKQNIIEFCHNENVTTEDKIFITLRGKDETRNVTFNISEIIEERKAKGKHSVNGVKWYRVRVSENGISI